MCGIIQFKNHHFPCMIFTYSTLYFVFQAGLVALTESLTAKVVCKAHFEQALRGSRPSLPTQPDKVEAKFKQLHR